MQEGLAPTLGRLGKMRAVTVTSTELPLPLVPRTVTRIRRLRWPTLVSEMHSDRPLWSTEHALPVFLATALGRKPTSVQSSTITGLVFIPELIRCGRRLGRGKGHPPDRGGVHDVDSTSLAHPRICVHREVAAAGLAGDHPERDHARRGAIVGVG